LYLHGSPGSRYLHPREFDFTKWGARMLTYDRPGYGRSDRRPGRLVADAAQDVRAIADHLSLAEFAVVGVSAGGPHALAVAAELAGRVTRCAVVNGLAPPDAEGLDFYAGMAESEVEEWRARTVPFPDAAAILEETRQWVDELAANPDIPPAAKEVFVPTLTEAISKGPWGVLDDYAAVSRSWGFELAAVTCPVTLMVAEADTSVPPAHGRWLTDHLPQPTFVSVAGGHLDPRVADTEQLLAWALDRL
jgi:pimeloyl-ACP methyl ester carboxylesterase